MKKSYSKEQKAGIITEYLSGKTITELSDKYGTSRSTLYNIFYICVIPNLYAGKVIACRISLNNSTQLTRGTFLSAYKDRHPEDLTFTAIGDAITHPQRSDYV